LRIFSLLTIFFYFGQLFENCRSSPYFGATLLQGAKLCINFEKMGWATFWAIFSQAQSGHPGRGKQYLQRNEWILYGGQFNFFSN
jgi:hypothetical protein